MPRDLPPTAPGQSFEIEKTAADLNPPRFKLVAFDDIALSTDGAYLIKNLIPREGVVVVWGPPKCGKSFWTYDAVMHIARGAEYRGRRVKGGVVVYVACEGERGLGARTEAYRRERLAEDAAGIPFYLITTQLRLADDRAELEADIRSQLPGISPAAIVIDTLNRSIGGDENSSDDMGGFIEAAAALVRAFKCTVIVIHHCGIDGNRPRGHTSLTGAVDAQIAITKDGDTITCTVEYMKDGPEGDTLHSRLEIVGIGTDQDGETISSCVITPVEQSAKASAGPPLTNNQRTMFTVLHKAGNIGMTVDEWNASARQAGLAANRKADLFDFRNALEGKKLVHHSGGRWYADR
jgi:RecA-family ATPase